MSEQGSVEAFLEAVADSWKTNDGSALGEFFTPDGSLINPFGERADGRGAVADLYTDYFGGLLEGTTTTITLEACRPIDPDHVLIDAEQPIYARDGAVVLVAHLVALLRRDADTWQFVDCRPYPFAPRP